MDRLAWLDCQAWLLPWLGCSKGTCTPCGEGRPKLCHNVDWLFNGFASFHLSCNDQAEKEGFGPLCQDAAHLFFHASPPTSDPAQMVLRLGVSTVEPPEKASISHAACSERAAFVLLFDDSKPFLLDYRQAEKTSSWKPEMGCNLCNNAVTASDIEDEMNKKHSCICQQMPLHVTIKFRHVAMNIYSSIPFDERVEDHFQMLFGEARHSINDDKPQDVAVGTDAFKDATQSIPDSTELLKNSEINFKHFLKRIDCMCTCAVKAVDVCSADQHQMAQLLLHMTQHAGDRAQKMKELKSLLQCIHFYLKTFQQQEKEHMATIWGCTMHPNPDVKAISTTALQNARQQIKQLQEATLWLDLVCAAYSNEV